MGCESLEDRRLLSATLDSDGVLHVTATSAADVVGIREDLVNAKWRVGINNTLAKFDIAAVKSIQIDLGEGNDRLDFAGTLGFYCLGGLGDDTINGGDGNDTITAGGGRDSVMGGAGDDRIDGGPTSDKLLDGGLGADRIYGSDGNDLLIGDAGVDRLYGGNGNDVLLGGSSNDKLYGDDGNDSLNGGNQNDLLTGGIGDDQIFGGDGNDTLVGQDGNDLLEGQADADTSFGDAGNDTILDGGGNDSLVGGDGDDSLSGSDGNDTLRGGAGNDFLDGGNNTDSLDGGDGDDSLSGGAGHDQLLGGAGEDALLGGRDEDTLTGGDGADRFLDRIKDTNTDRTAADARIDFTDGNLIWTDDDIWQVDVGLKWLQQRTGGVKILKLSNGKDFQIERDSNVGSDILGDNDSQGTIRMTDLAFEHDPFFGADVTIVHEIAHNWDTDDENPGMKSFFDLSKWKGEDPNWTYDPRADFARDYGKTNPYEDFATSVEVYYSHFNPASDFQAKWNWVDNWLNTMAN